MVPVFTGRNLALVVVFTGRNLALVAVFTGWNLALVAVFTGRNQSLVTSKYSAVHLIRKKIEDQEDKCEAQLNKDWGGHSFKRNICVLFSNVIS